MIRTVSKVVAIAFSIIAMTTSSVHAYTPKGEKVLENGFDIIEARATKQFTYVKPDVKQLAKIEEEIRKEKEEQAKIKAEQDRITERASKIKDYLSSRGAPLAQFAEQIVKSGESNGVEPELIAAISVIESGGGRVNFRPYNAWGWGSRSFSNWEHAIEEYAKGLAKGYILKGLDTPQEIAPYYCPPNKYKWANNVSYVLSQMRG